MPTKLEKLLDSIDPDRTSEVTFRRANEAINAFDTPARLKRWDDFKACMGSFCSHVEAYVLSLHEPIPVAPDYYWSRGVRILLKIYGINGEKAAFEMARTGNDGGLYAVLKAVAMHIADEYAHNEIAARICDYWEGLSLEEQLAASTEYISKYGHLLPSELTEGSAGRIRANLPKVLEKHHELIRKIRRVGR